MADTTGPPWFASIKGAELVAGALVHAGAVQHDSRRVEPGDVFVAVPGFSADGHRFIPDALARGAAAVVVEADRRDTWSPHAASGAAAFVAVSDARVALAQAAAGLYGHPARALGMVGVTGTDGKTTTTHLIAHVLTACGLRAGHLSSVEFSDGEEVELNATHMTTTEANDIQRQLSRIRDAGAQYAVVEASSIGLDLHRVDECEFDAGVFTNLTPDHLDYHGDMERYRVAKGILFDMLGRSILKGFPKAAVLNADDAASAHYREAAHVPVTTYGMRSRADIVASNIEADGLATRFRLHARGSVDVVRIPLAGAYNVANCLAAVGVALSQGCDLQKAAASLATFPGVPGRLECIDEGQPFRVVVDIASTGPAMRNVLSILRPVTGGRMIVLFGAAGERDVTRRSAIAQAVADLADDAVITNEDPRSEDPDAILDEIASALRQGGMSAFGREADRRAAMRLAFARAGAGDTVLLAGKATEQSIVIGTTHHPWDERAVARELLRSANTT